jgi:hypothetical protein
MVIIFKDGECHVNWNLPRELRSTAISFINWFEEEKAGMIPLQPHVEIRALAIWPSPNTNMQ